MKRFAAVLLLGTSLAACSGSDSVPVTTQAVSTTTAVPTTQTTAATTTSAPSSTESNSNLTEGEATTTTTAVPDTEPPELAVTFPTEWATVADAEVTFLGTVEPGVQGVWAMPDFEASVDGDGNWEVTVGLDSGLNEVVFFTLDQAANETTVAHHVTYTAPMPCDGFEVIAEHASAFPLGPTDWCGGWGYIPSADANEIIFDLAQVTLNVAGDESQGWSIVNNNPMFRYLPISSDIEIRACPPESGDTWPGYCGTFWVGPDPGWFQLWGIDDLNGFVNSSDMLWHVLIDPSTGEVVWVEQWWSP